MKGKVTLQPPGILSGVFTMVMLSVLLALSVVTFTREVLVMMLQESLTVLTTSDAEFNRELDKHGAVLHNSFSNCAPPLDCPKPGPDTAGDNSIEFKVQHRSGFDAPDGIIASEVSFFDNTVKRGINCMNDGGAGNKGLVDLETLSLTAIGLVAITF